MVRAARTARLGNYVVLDYPATSLASSASRGTGRLNDLIAAGEPEYRRTLDMIASFEEDLARIPRRVEGGRSPSWVNDFLPGLDSASIYGFLRSRGSQTYLEVGSGTSTRFARRAIDDGALPTRIVSIDPSPRAEVDELCDEVVRQPLELADTAMFSRLRGGDVLFVDGSHRVFTGSDATVFVLDLLPSLAPGVLVGVHDIYLPDDYPDQVRDRHYSEQYLLGALLLGEPAWIHVVLAANYVSNRPGLAAALESMWSRPELAGVETHGVGFWFEIGQPGLG